MEFVKVLQNEDNKKRALFFLPENTKHYVYSYVLNDVAHETMVFESDADGNILNHEELAMGSGYVPSWEIMGQVKTTKH